MTRFGDRLDLCFPVRPRPSGMKGIPPTSFRRPFVYCLDACFPKPSRQLFQTGLYRLMSACSANTIQTGTIVSTRHEKVFEREIIDLINGARMLPDPQPQRRMFDIQFTTRSRTFGNRLAGVDGSRTPSAIGRYSAIAAFIVERVDSRPLDSRDHYPAVSVPASRSARRCLP